MSGLSDMIARNRKRMAAGGPVSPYALQNQAILNQTAAMRLGQGQEAAQGALNTAPPPALTVDLSTTDPEAPTLQSTEMVRRGFGPRMLEAGVQDLSSSIKGALGATAQALGNGPLALRAQASAKEDQLRADQLTQDQVRQASDVSTFGQGMNYLGGQILRGAPSMAAMAVPGMLTKGLAGIAVPSAILNTGSEFNRAHGAIDAQQESGAVTPDRATELRANVPAAAFGGGALGALIDSTTFGYLLKKSPFAMSQAKGLVAHALGSEAIMAGGGAAREAAEQVLTRSALENPDIFKMGPSDREAMLNAAAANAAGALPFVAPGHFAHAIGSGVDATIGAAGKVARRFAGPEGDEAPAPTPPSTASNAGNALAGLIKGDPAKAGEAAQALVSKFLETPGVAALAKAGGDFFGPVNEAVKDTRAYKWLGAKTAELSAGLDTLTAEAKKAYGENVDTSNLAAAKENLLGGLAGVLHANGYDSASLGKLSGERLAALVTAFGKGVLASEEVTRNLFGGVVAGAKNAADEFSARATTENMGVPSSTDVAAGLSTAGAVGGAAAGAAVHAVDKGIGTAKDFTEGIMDGWAGHNATSPETDRGFQELGKQFGASAPANGPKKSLVGTPDKDAKAVKEALLSMRPNASSEEATLLAKRISEVITRSPAEFEGFIRQPVVAGLIKHYFDRTPSGFSKRIKTNLRIGEDKAAGDRLGDAKVLDPTDQAIEGNRAREEEAPQGEEGAGEILEPSEDALAEVSHPNEDGARHPAMTPEMFDQMKATPRQLKGRAADVGSNASVRITRQRVDAKTGQKLGEPTSSDEVLNLQNVARAWAPQREPNEKARMFGESTQRKFDDNFKQGLAGALQGWEETEKDGTKVQVSVAPMHGGGEPVTDFKKWLRPTSVTGPDLKNGGPRHFADLEKPSGTPVDLGSAVGRYESDATNAYDASLAKYGNEKYATEARRKAQLQAAEHVARLAIEQFKDKIEVLSPENQARRVEQLREFLKNPSQEHSIGVDPTIAGIPVEILRDGGMRLMADLDKLDYDVVQGRLKGEQETSVDNPNRLGNIPDEPIYPPGTEQPTKRVEQVHVAKPSRDSSGESPHVQPGEVRTTEPAVMRGERMAEVPAGPRVYTPENRDQGELFGLPKAQPTNTIAGRRSSLDEDKPGVRAEDLRNISHTPADIEQAGKDAGAHEARKALETAARDHLRELWLHATTDTGRSIIQDAASRIAGRKVGKETISKVPSMLPDNALRAIAQVKGPGELRALLDTISKSNKYPMTARQGAEGVVTADDKADGPYTVVQRPHKTPSPVPSTKNSVEAPEAKNVVPSTQNKEGGKKGPKAPAGPEAGDLGKQVREMSLQAQRDAGWDTDWPFIPADLQNSDFVRLIKNDPKMSAAKKTRILEAGKKLGVISPGEPGVKKSLYGKQKKPGVTIEQDEMGRWGWVDASGERQEGHGAETEPPYGYLTREAAIAGAEYHGNHVMTPEEVASERAEQEKLFAKWDSEREAKKSRADVNTSETPLNSTDPKVQKDLVDAIQKITGKNIGVGFDENQPHQGQYDHAKKLITLAATQAFAPSNAHHEAFHAVYDNYLSPEDRKIAYKAFRSGLAKEQIRHFLKDSPEAWEAAKNDPQELMAYGFQAWHAGALDFTPATRNVFKKIVDFYNKVMDWLHDQPTAQQMMEQIRDGLFADGKTSPAERALARSPTVLRRVQQVTGPMFQYADKLYDNLVTPYDTRIRDMGNPYADRIAKHFYAQTGETGKQRGMVQEIPIQTTKWLNRLDKLAREVGFEQALKDRALGKEPETDLEKRLDREIEAHYEYQIGAGMKLGKVENYLPLSWDGEKIEAKQNQFIAMLKSHQADIDALNAELQARSGKGLAFRPLTADGIYQMMSKRGRIADEFMGEAFDENGAPLANHSLDRVFGFLKNEDRAPFVRDDLYGGLQTYVKQMARRAEWSRRFNEDGSKFKALLDQAREFGLTKEDEKLIKDYKDDAFAAKLYDVNPTIRKVLAANTVYQNYRVLSMSLLSNLIDPFGVAVRSGEWNDAWDSYKLAAGRMFKSGRMRTEDLQALSEDIGSIQRASVQDSLLERYGGVNIEGKLGALNDKLFTYNGMNGLTRSVRLAALVSGINFVKRHAQGFDTHSERHLRELGLTKDDVKVADGSLAVRPKDFEDGWGMAPDEAIKASDKIQTALNRFVDESAMRPNVGERTRWGSNPYLAPLYHLKQYVFSFNKVINKKLENELLEHNNVTPYLMAACYVPIMSGTAMLRDMMLNGGTLPEKNGFLHYAGSGFARSGLMGPSDLMELGVGGVAFGDINKLKQLAGPTVDQSLDIIGALSSAGGTHSLSKTIAEALPGGSFFQHYAR